jgi:selenide,water dikinase
MLRAADLAAEIDLAEVPLLPGAAELLGEGLESTLAPANRGAEQEMEIPESLRASAAFAALFDPQTCGGLLIAVQRELAHELVRDFDGCGDVSAAIVGTVVSRENDKARISVVTAPKTAGLNPAAR